MRAMAGPFFFAEAHLRALRLKETQERTMLAVFLLLHRYNHGIFFIY